MTSATTSNPGSRTSTWLLYGAVLLGVAVRLVQYFRRPALWLDEAMLSLSIVKRPARQLIFSPLEFNQSAPPGYLQFAKLSTIVFGPSDLALRFPAMVFSVASVLLFTWLARRVLDKGAAVVAVAIFAISAILAVYAAEAKPYASDVFVATLLTVLAIRMRDSRFAWKWVIASLAAIMISVFLADTAVIVVTGVGLALVYLAWKEKDQVAFRMAKLLSPLWVIAGIGAVLGIQRRLGGHTGKMLTSAWSGSFWPIPPRSLEDLWWPIRMTSRMFDFVACVRPFYGATLVLAVFGVWALWRSGKRDVAAILGGPFIVSLLVSAAGRYPFNAGRVSLYLAPVLIIALAAGVGYVANRWPARRTLIQVVLFFLLINPQLFVLSSSPPAWLIEDVPSVLSRVSASRQPGDKIYVYWGALPATLLYGPRYGIKQSDIIAGGMHDRDLAAYGQDLDSLRGSPRVWVIFAHDHMRDQRDAILMHLDSIGRRENTATYPAQVPRPDATVFLYDLREKSPEASQPAR